MPILVHQDQEKVDFKGGIMHYVNLWWLLVLLTNDMRTLFLLVADGGKWYKLKKKQLHDF